jgi:magnesium-transporting ATPase (P-type)
VKQADGEW